MEDNALENLFAVEMEKRQVDAITNLGLAHVGDGVYELLVRSYLCLRGDVTVKRLHKDTVELVKAPAQAALVEKILPVLTEEEQAYYRRGKNSHTHAAPKSASPKEYAKATGLETLFGALYLLGRRERLNQLFTLMME
jgi:ribonuclease-3 family protein